MEEVVGSNPTRSTKSFLRALPTVYVLQSRTTQKFYIGCANDVAARLAEHERGQTTATRGRGPWVLVYREDFEDLSSARRRERQLKSWKSHRSVQQLIDAARRSG